MQARYGENTREFFIMFDCCRSKRPSHKTNNYTIRIDCPFTMIFERKSKFFEELKLPMDKKTEKMDLTVKNEETEI